MPEKYSIVYKYGNFFICSSVDGPYLWGKNRDTDIENRLDTIKEGENGKNRESSIETYALPYVK